MRAKYEWNGIECAIKKMNSDGEAFGFEVSNRNHWR